MFELAKYICLHAVFIFQLVVTLYSPLNFNGKIKNEIFEMIRNIILKLKG